MREAASDRAPSPFVWSVAQYCLDLPGGAIRHFPAGTYNEQVQSHAGRLELQLMNTAHMAWYMFKQTSVKQWGGDELRFAKWMADDGPPPPPTRRLDFVIEVLWRTSGWFALIMDRLRGVTSG